MITIPPSVVSDLTALVSETRGKNTIISTYAILDTIETGAYPVSLFWLANYDKGRNQALTLALKQTGLEPHTKKRDGAVRSWKVTL